MKSIKWILLAPIILLMTQCDYNEQSLELDDEIKLVDALLFNSKAKIPHHWIFVDNRPASNYLDGHIPNAVNIWRDEMSDSLGIMLSKEMLESILGGKGLSSSSKLILYDDHGAAETARFWWVMQANGFENIHILNGGFESWKQLNLPVTNVPIKRDVQQFKFPLPSNNDLSVDFQYIVNHLKDSSIVLIDTRTAEEYNGTVLKNGAKRAGNIPGSIHIDYTESVGQADGQGKKLLTATELRALFESHGIFPNDTIITYCHSGARSAQTTFILSQILKYPHVKNYDGSWVEWSRKTPL